MHHPMCACLSPPICLADIPKQAYWRPKETDSLYYDARYLEANLEVIKEEYQEISRRWSHWRKNKTNKGSWNLFYLVNQVSWVGVPSPLFIIGEGHIFTGFKT